uniref:Uncharacterized protein n=1 Tax=Octopus bimaculoides TaxID=37653 RepID=A0A0L8FSN4_OCTBM
MMTSPISSCFKYVLVSTQFDGIAVFYRDFNRILCISFARMSNVFCALILMSSSLLMKFQLSFPRHFDDMTVFCTDFRHVQHWIDTFTIFAEISIMSCALIDDLSTQKGISNLSSAHILISSQFKRKTLSMSSALMQYCNSTLWWTGGFSIDF